MPNKWNPLNPIDRIVDLYLKSFDNPPLCLRFCYSWNNKTGRSEGISMRIVDDRLTSVSSDYLPLPYYPDYLHQEAEVCMLVHTNRSQFVVSKDHLKSWIQDGVWNEEAPLNSTAINQHTKCVIGRKEFEVSGQDEPHIRVLLEKSKYIRVVLDCTNKCMGWSETEGGYLDRISKEISRQLQPEGDIYD